MSADPAGEHRPRPIGDELATIDRDRHSAGLTTAEDTDVDGVTPDPGCFELDVVETALFA